MTVTLDELRLATAEMVVSGRAFVRAWARVHAPDLPPATLEAVLCAIGEIGIHEALAVLVREHAEAARRGDATP